MSDDQPTLIIGNGERAKPGDTVWNAHIKGCPARVLIFETTVGWRPSRWRLKGIGITAVPADLFATQAEARAKRLADLVELEGRQVKALKATQAEIKKLETATR